MKWDYRKLLFALGLLVPNVGKGVHSVRHVLESAVLAKDFSEALAAISWVFRFHPWGAILGLFYFNWAILAAFVFQPFKSRGE